MPFFHNNRYQRKAKITKTYLKRNWKPLLIMFIGVWIIVTWIISALVQSTLLRTGSIYKVPGQYINPFYVFYYAYVRGNIAPISIMLCGGLAFGACLYKMRVDADDKLFDPRPDCDFMISPTGTYGTSRLMDEEEKEDFQKRVKVEETDKIIIGMNDDNTVQVLADRNKEGKKISMGPHKFVSGASGSWKTSSVFIPDIMQTILKGESMICTDPKGELRAKCTKMAQKHGYITRELNLINPIVSDGIDFMKLIDGYADARTFTDIIMQNTEEGAVHKEDFWAKGERAAICFGILYVMEAEEFKGKRTFSNVYKFLRENPCAKISTKVAALPEGSLAARQWEIFQTTPENSQGGIMTGVATRLQILNDDTIARIVDTDEIDILAPGREKCIYFVIISDQESTNNLIAALFFSFMFIKLTKEADSHYNQELEVPVTFELDEMMNVGKIPDFPKKLSTIRSRLMKCTICTQDIGQLKDAYPGNLWANIIGNCDTKVMLGVNDIEVSAPYWSKSTGTMTIIARSEKKTENIRRAYTRNDILNVSEGEGKREVFLPAEIMQLPNEYQLVFFRGHNVQMIKKFSYFNHPMYKEIESELYTEHEPQWWKTVAEEMNNCPDIKKYEWFTKEIEKLEANKKRLELERKKAEAKEKVTEKKTVSNRAASGVKGEDLTAKDKAKILYYRFCDFKYKIHSFLYDLDKEPKEVSNEVEELDITTTEFEKYDGSVETLPDNEEEAYLDDADIPESAFIKDNSSTTAAQGTENMAGPDYEPSYEPDYSSEGYDESYDGNTAYEEPDFSDEPTYDEPEFSNEPEQSNFTEEAEEDDPESKLNKAIDKGFKEKKEKEETPKEAEGSLIDSILAHTKEAQEQKSRNVEVPEKHKSNKGKVKTLAQEFLDDEDAPMPPSSTKSSGQMMTNVLNTMGEKIKEQEERQNRIRQKRNSGKKI